jgi:XisI protein
MDRLAQYRQLVQQILQAHSQFQSSYGEVETFPAFDLEHDHYQVISIGWENRRRVYGCLIHVDIKGDKIWIQHDGTEVGVANQLVELGVPKQDIVLGYHTPNARRYTEFAVG